MTDIDFDELDKAVNSALGPRLEKESEEAKITPKAADSSESKPAENTVKAKEGARAAAPTIEVKSRQIIASPAAKRSGRFMDMVHPSSDMAQEKAVDAPAPRVKIVPTENAPKPEPTVNPISNEVTLAEAEPKPDEQTDSIPVSVGPVYPDPLDVVQRPAEETTKPDATESIDTLETTADTPEPVVPVVAPTPPDPAPETPFIPDAKVEKRPLGGPAPEIDAPSDAEPKPEDAPKEPDTQLPPEAALPPALQSDVVAVESDVVPEIDEAKRGYDLEDESSEKETPAEVETAVKTEETEKKDKASTEPVTTPLSQSIPQQYHSEVEPTDETPRPVFDTDQYHQPLIPAHTAKKSHAGLFILLILALLLIGAGLGYFAYVSGF